MKELMTMMKYTTPETKCQELKTQLNLCGHGYAPKRNGVQVAGLYF